MSEFLNDIMAGDRTAIIQAASLYSVVMGVWSIGYCLRLRRWPSVVGKLEKAGVGKFGTAMTLSDQTYQADVLYAYSVDGQQYEGSRLSPTIMLVSHNAQALLKWQMKGIKELGEDRVRVFYNPKKPRKSYLIVPPIRTIVVVAIVMFGAAALMLAAV